ncbi:hemerythrin domain-containing protein [Patescibacteria group bacterium]|nr:hemerythrin domain-containing protein [Patescibacteria group bacterium]
MKATDVIKRDHRAAEELFEKYKNVAHEDRAAMEEKIFQALDAHENMEDTYFYPELMAAAPDMEGLAELESEQGELEKEVEAVRAMEGDRDEAIMGMMDKVLTHAKKEEEEILAPAEEILGAHKLEELGAQMEPESAVAKDEG